MDIGNRQLPTTPMVRPPETVGSDRRLRGLSSARAAELAAEGRSNVDRSRQRRDRDVVRSNALTFFNVVLGVMILALLGAGEIRDGLFVGSVVAANVAIATLQELQATRRLRRLRALTAPRAHVIRDGVERAIDASEVVEGDLVHLRPGDQVVADGPIVARSAELDESLLTGESEPVRREPGTALRSGSHCVAGDCYYRARRVGAESYVSRLTAEARALVKRTTPLMQRFRRLFRVLLILTGLLAGALLIQFNLQERGLGESLKAATATVTTVVPVGLLLGMTVVNAVGALRVSRAGAVVQDINAVEALNYVDLIGLDKTGTLTTNRLALDRVHWLPGREHLAPWLGAFAVATGEENKTARALQDALAGSSNGARAIASVPFSSARRWSAAELELGGERRVLVLGAPETLAGSAGGGGVELLERYADEAARGRRGLVLATAPSLPSVEAPPGDLEPVALITLADELRHDVHEAFELMARLAIEPRIISGDHPETVSALLAQLGIATKGRPIAGTELEGRGPEELADLLDAHSVFGRVSPAQKADLIEAAKERGHFVAMVGDGANDVRALRAADIGVAMASGTSTARAVAGIVLLDDSFAALIRGTREATFVLGNTARLTKLFVTKSVYAFVLILATNMLGLDFPFLPRQGSVVSLLTLGIPALFISIGVPPRSEIDFTRNVLRFALPAGVALAISTMTLQFVMEGLLGRDIEEARTLVSLTIALAALAYVIEVLGLEGANWRRPARPILTLGLAGGLAALLVLTMSTPWLRDFFAFREVSAAGWVAVLLGVAAALAGQYLLSRHWQRLLDFLTAAPRAEERPRGHARAGDPGERRV